MCPPLLTAPPCARQSSQCTRIAPQQNNHLMDLSKAQIIMHRALRNDVYADGISCYTAAAGPVMPCQGHLPSRSQASLKFARLHLPSKLLGRPRKAVPGAPCPQRGQPSAPGSPRRQQKQFGTVEADRPCAGPPAVFRPCQGRSQPGSAEAAAPEGPEVDLGA